MMFPNMREIIPEGESGNLRIEHFEISSKEAKFAVMKAGFSRNYLGRMIRPGKFCRLVNGESTFDKVLMSDTHAERNTNRDVVNAAHGDVLIAGLGLGMIICPIAQKDEVNSTTVIEISQDVIDLVEPYIRKYLKDDADKITIIHEDIFEYKPTQKFDTIYFDIWGSFSGDEYPDTKKLIRKFSGSLVRDDDYYMDCWMRWLIKDKYFGTW